ncbi:Hypothetical protein IALB_2302 [Ignavibacterium album JCM 16511]|uniref:Uncharacterized protein n=1 Tax=Ignavibacterium album (strain DSM 19864 / JCM 16511 / NBRC 101810 / Mat9-16) TaxID=945713 RepID=I0ALZ8_IGNAJ|nr:hypothetical protein [Ignavibacterium album]AFH50005.1 Hypothetical protein IALB_2302 [Ignavibacterium album JCM 16511]
MFKDILKIAHKNGIVLCKDKFVYQNNEIVFADFILYVNKHKFYEGIEGAIIKSKNVLFNSDRYKITDVK